MPLQLPSCRGSLPVAGLMTLSLLLAACGSSDGTTSSSPSPTITGTAAVGAPLVGANISAKCKNGSSYTATAPTSGSGNYGIVVPSSAFPCAIRATGGSIGSGGPANSQNYHSFSQASGNTNVTPLTDLALALQVNTTASQAIADWFNAPGTTWDTISTQLGTALDDLRDALSAAGYAIPASWTAGSTAPFTATFTPDPGSDPFDRLLDDLANAIENSATYADYSELLTAFASGNSLPDAPEDTTPGGNGAALAGAEGITGTLNGVTYTYTTTVTATASTNPANPVGNLSAGTDADNLWLITGIPATVGSYDCKSIGDQPFIRLRKAGVNSGTHPTGGACRIEVINVTANSIEGRFSATLINAGTAEGTVMDGYFRKSNPGDSGGACSGDTKAAFTAVNGDYELFAKFTGNGSPDTVFTNRNHYEVNVDDSNCSLSVETNTGTRTFTLADTSTNTIINNAAGTDLILRYSNGETVFFSYDKVKKIASTSTYESDTPRWSLKGPDTARCPAQANTIATPVAMGAGPYVIAYSDAGNSTQGHIGIDQRTNVTASFSENQGLFGYRASANEDWSHGCAWNNNPVGDAVIRIGKWHRGSTSLGYYDSHGITYTQYDGFHYAIAQAVNNKPATGSKSYEQPTGWQSEISNNALTGGGTITCNGNGGACVTVDFSSNTANVSITVTPASTGTPVVFAQSNAAVDGNGLIFVNGSGNTALRLLLAGPDANYIAGSFISGGTSGSLGLKVQP